MRLPDRLLQRLAEAESRAHVDAAAQRDDARLSWLMLAAVIGADLREPDPVTARLLDLAEQGAPIPRSRPVRRPFTLEQIDQVLASDA